MTKFQNSCDMTFAKALVRQNMASYYEQYNIVWNDEHFDQTWAEFENIQILKDSAKVGFIRLWRKRSVLYIRDLQVSHLHQGFGIGTMAVKHSINIAKSENMKSIKLKVFVGNPAQKLYQRLGFRENMHDGPFILMELKLDN
ncbi:GNAT family N-acetyltransferase [Oceanospirillaceae bacterium]|nr:GNAT family N-acetyltransferase [Oceanospirillaceae bacterium]